MKTSNQSGTPDYIPVTVPEGASLSPQKGNLTGIPRQVRDNCAEWHNLIQRWANHNTDGMAIIQDICNKKLESSFQTQVVAVDDSTTDGVSPNDYASNDLQEACNRLEDIYNQMVKHHKKMEKVTHKFEVLVSLDAYQKNHSSLSLSSLDTSSFSEDTPIFKTWKMQNFFEASTKLLTFYSNELQVKNKIFENVAHCTNRDVLMFLSATWAHEPYIRDDSKLILESMLIESGHRYRLK